MEKYIGGYIVVYARDGWEHCGYGCALWVQ